MSHSPRNVASTVPEMLRTRFDCQLIQEKPLLPLCQTWQYPRPLYMQDISPLSGCFAEPCLVEKPSASETVVATAFFAACGLPQERVPMTVSELWSCIHRRGKYRHLMTFPLFWRVRDRTRPGSTAASNQVRHRFRVGTKRRIAQGRFPCSIHAGHRFSRRQVATSRRKSCRVTDMEYLLKQTFHDLPLNYRSKGTRSSWRDTRCFFKCSNSDRR